MKKLLIFICFIFSLFSFSQILPPDYDPNKCYIHCFEVDKKIILKEVDCDSLTNLVLTTDKVAFNKKKRTFRLKMIEHQKMLKSKGYKVDISGELDDKTIKAHNKYILKKEKLLKREKRKAEKSNTNKKE